MLSIRDERSYYYLYMNDDGATALRIFEKNLFPRYFNDIVQDC